MKWPWTRRYSTHVDALDAIARGERKLNEELGQIQRVDRVARRSKAVGERNHFAETWAAALAARQGRAEGS